MSRLSLLFLFSLFLVGGCNSAPDITCEKENLPGLTKIAVKFITKELKKDRESEGLEFSDFEISKRTCRALKREKRVSFKLKAKVKDGGRIKPIKFSCRYGKLDKKVDEMRTLCQMM